MRDITSFTGPHRWLSNFWPAPVSLDGVVYPTVEHAYVAAKTRDSTWRSAVLACGTPGDAKRLGRRMNLRSDWNAVRVDVMRDLLEQKFSNPTLAEKLLATGDALLQEGNTWGDTFWGVCNGRGENMLGKLLMEVRIGIRYA